MVRKMLEMVGNFPYCAALSMEDEVAEIQQHHGSRHDIAGWIDPVFDQSILAVLQAQAALKPVIGMISSGRNRFSASIGRGCRSKARSSRASLSLSANSGWRGVSRSPLFG